MKKALLYVFTAVLLGAVMMLFPQWIFWVSYATSAEILNGGSYALERSFGEALSVSPKEWEFTRLPEKPSYEQTTSYEGVEIFLVSFVLAVIVRFFYKRRAPYPRYQLPPF